MFEASNLASGTKNATVQTIHEANRSVFVETEVQEDN